MIHKYLYLKNFQSDLKCQAENGKWKINYQGTTLIELLLYMGLLAIFIGVLSGLFGTAIDIHLASQSTTGIATDTAFILSRLKYDIQRAQNITIPAALGESSQSLTLVINNIDHTYTTDGNGNLIYTNNLGSFHLNSYLAGVSDMTFTRIGNSGGLEPTLKIDLTVASRVVQIKGQETQQISTTVALHRNQ